MDMQGRLDRALRETTRFLLEKRQGAHWVGELSSSALSTATAVIALSVLARSRGELADEALIAGGIRWLEQNQNADGGWGDTVLSRSNISTTALCWAALGVAGAGRSGEAASRETPSAGERAEAWLHRESGGGGEGWTGRLAEAIRKRYGKDRTFSVPILMACTLAGRLGERGWQEIPALPFELAALPHRFFGVLQLPVVSYALPALIAIGQVIHHFNPSRNPLLRSLRDLLRGRTYTVLESIQPLNGGFLEATPLTSFVLMSLAAMGAGESLVARRAADFIRASVRGDGSWPIDTNLATWVTGWAVHALDWQGDVLGYEGRHEIREWILGQQYLREHPYTHAAPGGWAWTNLPGGVPDADDTPGALLALLKLGPVDGRLRQAGELGVRWLLDLQNRDGGMPTFCRGWGALPFDRSTPDLTAHALRAWCAWMPQWEEELRRRCVNAVHAGLDYLRRTQRPDGGWVPLWFGNEHCVEEENVTYGTARVLMALRAVRGAGFVLERGLLEGGEACLVGLQRAEGGWGGGIGAPASVEETGLAVEALAGSAYSGAVERGVEWLIARVEAGGEWTRPSPIGFYFAKLWYFEALYPVVQTVAALGAARRYGVGGGVNLGERADVGSVG